MKNRLALLGIHLKAGSKPMHRVYAHQDKSPVDGVPFQVPVICEAMVADVAQSYMTVHWARLHNKFRSLYPHPKPGGASANASLGCRYLLKVTQRFMRFCVHCQCKRRRFVLSCSSFVRFQVFWGICGIDAQHAHYLRHNSEWASTIAGLFNNVSRCRPL